MLAGLAPALRAQEPAPPQADAGFSSEVPAAAPALPAQDLSQKAVAQPSCSGDAEHIEALRRTGFLSRAKCPDAKRLKEAIGRYRLTIGSPLDGDLTLEEVELLKDRAKRAALREPLKAQLQSDETLRRGLIASGALDSDAERATLADLREAVLRYRSAAGSSAMGALTEQEIAELKIVTDDVVAFAGLTPMPYPGTDLQMVVPVKLVGEKPTDSNSSWITYQGADEWMFAHYFANPVRSFTANAMAAKLLELRRAMYFDSLDITGDEFMLEGSAIKPGTDKPKADGTLNPVRELIMATAREQNGQLFGLQIKAFATPPASVQVPQLRIATLPAAELPSRAKVPETPEQTNWRLVLKAINNLIITDTNALNGRTSLPIRECRGVEHNHTLQRKVVNIVYASGREFLGLPKASDNAALKSMFGTKASPTIHIGCVRVSVPTTPGGAAKSTLPATRSLWRAGAVAAAAPERPYEFEIPPEPPKALDLASKNRYYFPAAERTATAVYDRAFLFIHGYNNDFAEAIMRTAHIAAESNYDGFIYTFSWPSQDSFSLYATDLDYAEQAEIDLAHFMRMILNTGVATRLDVLAHSMGSQILLRSLDAVRPQFDRRVGRGQKDTVRFGQVIFAAPDVAAPVFRRKAALLRQFADRVTVYVSANDGALGFSGWVRGVMRAGAFDEQGRPIQLDKIDVIDITGALIPWYSPRRYLPSNHSAFTVNERVLEDISTILKNGSSGKGFGWSPRVRAIANGRRGSIVPGDCEQSKTGNITWWKMKVDDTELTDCPATAQTATSSIR